MKKLCEFLRKQSIEIIIFFFLKLKLLRNKLQKSIENVNNCDFFKEEFEDNHGKDKNYHEVVIIIIQGI